jgi:hypothetical protein
VKKIVDEACDLTIKWLDENRQHVLSQPNFTPHVATEPLNWLGEPWSDDILPS